MDDAEGGRIQPGTVGLCSLHGSLSPVLEKVDSTANGFKWGGKTAYEPAALGHGLGKLVPKSLFFSAYDTFRLSFLL